MKKYKPAHLSVIEKVLYCIFVLIIFSLFALGCDRAKADNTKHVSDVEVKEEKIEPVEESKEALLTFVGDCMLADEWGKDDFNSAFEKNGAGYFLKKVKSLFVADDLTIANLEAPLTNSTKPYPKGENKAGETPLYYWYKGLPEYAKILVDGSVEIVNTANNHAHDFGDIGMSDTKNTLDEYEIEHFGYETTVIREINRIKIGFFGFAFNSNYDDISNVIAKLKNDGAKIVIAAFHEGADFAQYETTENQKAAAHNAIDAGADAVIEHHSHLIQGTEVYKGKFIAYSLANFCYGGQTTFRDYDTMIVQLKIVKKTGKDQYNITHEIIPASVSYADGYNNYQPTILKGEEGKRVLDRIKELDLDL